MPIRRSAMGGSVAGYVPTRNTRNRTLPLSFDYVSLSQTGMQYKQHFCIPAMHLILVSPIQQRENDHEGEGGRRNKLALLIFCPIRIIMIRI